MFSADDNSVVDGTRKITISGTMKEVMWAFNAVKGLILVCKLDNVLCGAWLLWLHMVTMVTWVEGICLSSARPV